MELNQAWQKLVCVAIWCGLSAWLMGCNSSNKEARAESSGTNMRSENTGMTQCVGRFQFLVPNDLEVTGRGQSTYETRVNTRLLPQGGIRAFVDSEVARIQALTPPVGVAKTLIRSFDLQPDIKGIWYFSDPDDRDIRELEAIKAENDYAVVAVRSSLAGKEAIVEKLVAAVAASYVRTTDRGFCVGDGSLTIDPGRTEETLISMKYRNVQRFELRFRTTTVSEPDNQTYSSVDEEKQVIEGLHGSMTVLKDHEISSAGCVEKRYGSLPRLPMILPLYASRGIFLGSPSTASSQ